MDTSGHPTRTEWTVRPASAYVLSADSASAKKDCGLREAERESRGVSPLCSDCVTLFDDGATRKRTAVSIGMQIRGVC